MYIFGKKLPLFQWFFLAFLTWSFFLGLLEKKSQSILHWGLGITGITIASFQLFVNNDLTWRLQESYTRQMNLLGYRYDFIQLEPGVITNISFGIGILIFIWAVWIAFDAKKRLAWKINHPIVVSTC